MGDENREGQKLLPYSEIIKLARQAGVSFGKGYPYNRLRYYTKIGLLPRAQRRSFGGSPEGCYPQWVVDKLVEIDRKLKQGKSIQSILREQKRQQQEAPREPLSLLPEAQTTLQLEPAVAQQDIYEGPNILASLVKSLALTGLVLIIGSSLLTTAYNLPPTHPLLQDTKDALLGRLVNKVPSNLVQRVAPSEIGEVLARTTSPYLKINVETEIAKLLDAFGGIKTDGADVNLSSGNLTASNVIYDIVAGDNVSISSGQTPTISVPGVGTGVDTVTGTSGRITSTGGDNPVLDISSSYSGQASIATLGTITSGTWNATPLTDPFVSNNITVSNYLPLSGGTLAGSLTLNDNDGVSSDVNLILGDANEEGNVVFNSGGGFTGTLTSAALGSNQIWTLPDETGTICTNTGGCGAAGAVFDVDADAGGAQTVNSGDTLTFNGGDGIATAIAAGPDVTIDVDANAADFEFVAGVLNLIAGAVEDDEVDDNITIDATGSVDWNALTNYPADCAAGSALTGFNDLNPDTFNCDAGFVESSVAESITAGWTVDTNPTIFNSTIELGALGATDNSSLLCRNTANILAGCNTGSGSGLDADTLDTLDSLDFLRSNADDTFEAGNTLTIAGSLDVSGIFTLGNDTNTGSIDTPDWDISTTGDMTGIGAITMDGNFSQTGIGTFSTGTGAISLNGDATVAANKNLALASGAGTFTQTYTGTATTAFTLLADSISTGTGILLSTDALTTGTALDISSTSTAGGAIGSSYLLKLNRSGNNANSEHTAYGLSSSVTTTYAVLPDLSTNIAGYFTATGAVANYAIYIPDQTDAKGTNYGLYIAGADNYAIYIDDTGGTPASGITFGADTNLYRSGASVLATDDVFSVGSLGAADSTTAVCRNSLNELATCTGGGSSSLWTDGGTVTYLTSTADDVAIGGTTLASPFSVDVENDTVRVGDGVGTNATLNLFASDGDTGSLIYNTSDQFQFSGGDVLIDQTATVGTNTTSTGAIYAAGAPFTTTVNQTLTSVETANEVGQFTSIAIGIDGFPVISYSDFSNTALRVTKCNDIACTGGDETSSQVDNAAAVGQYSSIAIGTDGLPVISYRDASAGSLKVAKCNDGACAGGDETITTVDDPANPVGLYTSIAIGTDGLPVISYQDLSAFSLKVAKCNDSACAGGDETITTVDDPAKPAGQYQSIAIGYLKGTG